MHEHLGEVLEATCRKGSNEAILIAPFVKLGAFKRLLEVLPASVSLLCITRWRPEEVAAGVSDPDIWLDIQQRAGATLRLCPSLHAKYYRIDTTCLIGSANITGAALGWSTAPNLEILCPFSGNTTEWQAFERQVMAQSVLCSDSIYQQIIATAALLKGNMPLPPLLAGEALAQQPGQTLTEEQDAMGIETGPTDLSHWLPQTRQPADLYIAYSGQTEQLTTASRAAALVDIAALQIPPGLPEESFSSYVGMQLLQMPCIAAVDNFVIQSQRFGAVTAYLQTLPCSEVPYFKAALAWQTLMRWLMYFLPDRYAYSVPRHSEVFQRRK